MDWALIIHEIVYVSTIFVSMDLFRIFVQSSNVLVLIFVILSIFMLLDYRKAFKDIFAKIVLSYTFAIIFTIVGGLILALALQPIIYGNLTYRDLTIMRNFFGTVGLAISTIPFIICYRSVAQFRKALLG